MEKKDNRLDIKFWFIRISIVYLRAILFPL